MAFEKVDTQVDFPAQERAILEFWERTGVFDKLREQNRGKPKWSFLDGPITANNPMGVHHAWGRTYKDAYQRYFAMTGHEERYQNGFDCQGLWVEVEVEKDLKLRSKRDIENLVPGDRFASIDRFVHLCKERVDKFARVQTEQSIRLGYWMDWDRDDDWRKPPDQRRSYYTMSEENNYTIWSFLKRCHDRGLVYRWYDAMPWCPRCSVGISQMEMHEGYQRVAHRAVFVRFPLKDREGESLLVWTTTPWTLTSNVAAAVNPNLTYLKVKHRDHCYYVGKGAFTARRLEEEFKRKEWVEGVPKLKPLEQIFKEKGGYEIVGEVSGADMVRQQWRYQGPFDELPAQNAYLGYPGTLVADLIVRHQRDLNPVSGERVNESHRVIEWEAVGETEGTGIVHIAPGCGKEDYELGKTNGLLLVAPLDEEGRFLSGFDFMDCHLSGKSANDDATTEHIIDLLKQKGLLLEVERYPHSYPHCWRCKTELLFRLVDEWFIDMKWRDEIVRVTEEVTFLPETINGKARELDWLRNMGDWMISKKRFWGLALPIWVCENGDCGEFTVIGDRKELKERAIEGWEQFEGHAPHRPWIDLVKIECRHCGSKASRIPDVGNPWLDAGIVPYSTMGYNRDRAYWEQWFPADFITECFPGQFRNWFYAILAMSTMMEQRPPFKVLLGHGLVRDQWDRPMHKSAGNAIPFEGAADEGYTLTDPKGAIQHYPPMSADLIRWLFCRSNPANNIDFGPGPAEELRSKFTLKLWHSYFFFCDNARIPAKQGGFDVNAPQVPVNERPDFDRWILSDLQKLIQKARGEFERFNVAAFCQEAEAFVDDKLSNWWVRRNKRRFWKSEAGTDKVAAYQTLHTVLITLVKLFAPIMPFLSEAMYRNLVDGPEDRSVHRCAFPEVDTALIDEDLSNDMDALLRVKGVGSAARNTVKMKVRQPLAEMKVLPGDERERRAVERFSELLCDELNIQKITLHHPDQGRLLALELNPNWKTLKPKLKSNLQVSLPTHNTEEAARHLLASLPLTVYLPDGTQAVLEKEDFVQSWKAPEGWAGIADRDTQVAIDCRITNELKREGQAREIVRQVNDTRKQAALDIEDRISLFLLTESSALRETIEAHRDYICAETLVKEWSNQPLGKGAYTTTVKVDGQALTIELRKA